MATTASTTTLAFRHIFGVNAHVNDNVSFTDDDTVVYVAGHSLVLYNLQEKRQRFIQSAEITGPITAYTSGSGKRLAAVAEHGEPPSFHVFDLRTFRRKKTITTADLVSKEIVCLQFSEDNQLLLTLSGAPDWMLMCWNWAKAKLIASATVSNGTPMYRCVFSPLDASVACCIGKDCVNFFRIGEKEMRPLQENTMPNHNFTSFCWMRFPDDHLLAGTDDGKIVLFRSGEFLMNVMCAPGSEYPIMSLVSITGGFIAGSSPGTFLFFFYDESKDQALFDSQFSLLSIVTAPELSSGYISMLALDTKDEVLVGITSDGQLLTVPALSPQTLTTEHVKYLISSFHGPKPITGMDVCVRKPLVLTCCRDNTLRMWNFRDHTLELLKVFPEEMYSVALHPTGLHCAVAFTDKVRLYHVLVDDLRLCMELSIKACRECAFSNGGHVFAAANGNSIIVYDFHTGEKIADLRGHNSKVRSLYWMPSGCQLLTCGQDGAVYLWALDGAKRTGEFVQKGIVYTSAVNSGHGVIVVGNDRSLRELAQPDLAPSKVYDAGLVLTNVAMSTIKSVLFGSTFEYGKPGYVRTYPYPITGDFDDYPCTNTPISRMRLTPDDNFLVVADEQGCICLLELKGRQDRYQRNNPTAYLDLTFLPDWSDEVLVTRAELDDCNTTVAELKTKVEELKLNNEYQLKLKDMNYSEKIKETTDKFVQELESAKEKLEMLQEVRVDYEIESIEKNKYMEELHQNNIQNMETGFQAKIMEMVDAYQQLVRDRDAQIERLDEQRRQLVLAHERYVDELTSDFEAKLDEDKQTRLQQEDEKAELEKELFESQEQLDDDIDTEIESMKRLYEEKLSLSRETTLKYKGENGIMKKKFLLMQRDIEDQKEEMKVLQAKERELHEQIKMLEKEVSAHKKEIKTRDVSIGEKEKRIYDLKKKNQELDKFKFVLDYKIRELKQQIEPRQLEIMAMRDRIKDMDAELEKYHKTNSSLDALIGDLRTKIDGLQNDSKGKRMQANVQENLIAAFRSEVQAAIVHIQTPPLLLEEVRKLVETYGSLTNVKPRIDPDVEKEYARHKEFLHKSVQDLKKALAAETQAHMEGNNRVMQANLALIADINRQRDSNRLMKNVVQAELGKIRQIIQRNNGIGGKSKKSGQGIGSMSLSVTKPPPLLDNAKSDNMATGDFRAAEAEEDLEPTELLERNRKRILALRAAISELDGKNRSNYMMMQKAFSKEMLPPLEGGASTHSNNHEELDNYQSETSDRFGKKNSFGNKEVLGISLPPVNREKNSAGGQLLLSGGSVGDNGLEYTGSNQLPVQVEASISLQMDTPFRGNGQVIGHGSTYATELPADDM